MSLDFTTRPAKQEDLDKILDLNLKLFKFASEFNDNFNLSWTVSKEGKEYFERRLSQSESRLFVAETEGKTIAYLIGKILGKVDYRLEKSVAKLENMFVLPDYRGQGVGSGLIEEFYDWCQERQVETIFTEISQQNTTAKEFYQKNNFHTKSTILERKVKPTK